MVAARSKSSRRGATDAISASTARTSPCQHAASKGVKPSASTAFASTSPHRNAQMVAMAPAPEELPEELPSSAPPNAAIAKCSAVSPPVSALFGSAPRVMSARHTSSCPHIAAAINGVRPCLFSASTLAPARSKLSAAFKSPSTHAAKSGAIPNEDSTTSESMRRGRSQCPESRNLMHASDPVAAAARSGVTPASSGDVASASTARLSTLAASRCPW